jgi:hypothetical protein
MERLHHQDFLPDPSADFSPGEPPEGLDIESLMQWHEAGLSQQERERREAKGREDAEQRTRALQKVLPAFFLALDRLAVPYKKETLQAFAEGEKSFFSVFSDEWQIALQRTRLSSDREIASWGEYAASLLQMLKDIYNATEPPAGVIVPKSPEEIPQAEVKSASAAK